MFPKLSHDMRISLVVRKIVPKYVPNNIILGINALIPKADELCSMEEIANIMAVITNRLLTVKKMCKPPSGDRQEFISSRLVEYLTAPTVDSNSVIVDIGGGDGNVLSYLGKGLNIPKNQLYSVESSNPTAWSEKYSQTNTNITYTQWDNITMPFPDNSVNVVIIMVALHHMSDDVMEQTLAEVARITAPGAFVLIKEHHCSDTDVKLAIDWEHHLYHILDYYQTHSSTQTLYDDMKSYLSTYTGNFKTDVYFRNKIMCHGFQLIDVRTRVFEHDIGTDVKNSTNLYLNIFKKIV